MKKNLKDDTNYVKKKHSLKSFFVQLIPMVMDMLPIFLERFLELQGKPTLKKLQEEQEELSLRISYLEKKMFWFMIFIIIQTIFILSLIVYLILKL